MVFFRWILRVPRRSPHGFQIQNKTFVCIIQKNKNTSQAPSQECCRRARCVAHMAAPAQAAGAASAAQPVIPVVASAPVFGVNATIALPFRLGATPDENLTELQKLLVSASEEAFRAENSVQVVNGNHHLTLSVGCELSMAHYESANFTPRLKLYSPDKKRTNILLSIKSFSVCIRDATGAITRSRNWTGNTSTGHTFSNFLLYKNLLANPNSFIVNNMITFEFQVLAEGESIERDQNKRKRENETDEVETLEYMFPSPEDLIGNGDITINFKNGENETFHKGSLLLVSQYFRGAFRIDSEKTHFDCTEFKKETFVHVMEICFKMCSLRIEHDTNPAFNSLIDTSNTEKMCECFKVCSFFQLQSIASLFEGYFLQNMTPEMCLSLLPISESIASTALQNYVSSYIVHHCKEIVDSPLAVSIFREYPNVGVRILRGMITE